MLWRICPSNFSLERTCSNELTFVFRTVRWGNSGRFYTETLNKAPKEDNPGKRFVLKSWQAFHYYYLETSLRLLNDGLNRETSSGEDALVVIEADVLTLGNSILNIR